MTFLCAEFFKLMQDVGYSRQFPLFSWLLPAHRRRKHSQSQSRHSRFYKKYI